MGQGLWSVVYDPPVAARFQRTRAHATHEEKPGAANTPKMNGTQAYEANHVSAPCRYVKHLEKYSRQDPNVRIIC